MTKPSAMDMPSPGRRLLVTDPPCAGDSTRSRVGIPPRGPKSVGWQNVGGRRPYARGESKSQYLHKRHRANRVLHVAMHNDGQFSIRHTFELRVWAAAWYSWRRPGARRARTCYPWSWTSVRCPVGDSRIDRS